MTIADIKKLEEKEHIFWEDIIEQQIAIKKDDYKEKSKYISYGPISRPTNKYQESYHCNADDCEYFDWNWNLFLDN